VASPPRRPLLRARLVVLRPGPEGPEVLLAYHRHPDRAFWCFPGGVVEAGESALEAARREALEETGLEVACEGVCFVCDRPEADAVEWFFRARPVAGEARLGGDPDRPSGSRVLEELRWFPCAGLEALSVQPVALAHALADGTFFSWGLLPAG
jgi:8-oxo-dGTP diphosphatase